MYDSIKKILEDGGKCLLIENGRPLGVVLTAEEYGKLKDGKKEDHKETNTKLAPKKEEPDLSRAAKLLGDEILENLKELESEIPTGDAVFSEDLTLEDLGLGEAEY